MGDTPQPGQDRLRIVALPSEGVFGSEAVMDIGGEVLGQGGVVMRVYALEPVDAAEAAPPLRDQTL